MKNDAETSGRRRKLDAPVARIGLVDDHALVRRGLAEMVDREPDMEVCGEAADASSALDMIEIAEPELVIVDITLKEGSGLELIKQIKVRYASVRMLVLSMHDEKIYAERALRAGAMGYLNKEEPADKVIEAIREVLAGRIYLSGQMADRILQRLVDREADLERSPIDALSDRELEVLELIGRGLTTRHIAKELHLSRKTVDTYRENLKAKLQLSTAAELVRFAVAWTLDRK
ncbi:MAG: response regulator [Gemmatimonadetes bacterium]|nr:response regulator [Gemmatimonadota bacterium]